MIKGQAMQNVNNATINSPSQVTSGPSNPNGAQPQNTVEQASITRKVGSTLANVGKQAGSLGVNVATNVAGNTADYVLHQSKSTLQHWIKRQLGHTLENIAILPFVGAPIINSIGTAIFPKYQEMNPNTTLNQQSFNHLLFEGRVENIMDDLLPILETYLRKHLSPEDQEKLQSGSNNLLMIKAFSKAMYNEAKGGVQTAKEPGGLKKIGRGIANFIPIINRLPEGAKPWVGGTLGAFVAYKVLHGFFKLVKWAILGITGYKGLQFVKNKIGGTGAHQAEIVTKKSKGKLGGLMEGLGRAAQMAGGAAPGMMGGGAPGGGLANLVGALAGGGK